MSKYFILVSNLTKIYKTKMINFDCTFRTHNRMTTFMGQDIEMRLENNSLDKVYRR